MLDLRSGLFTTPTASDRERWAKMLRLRSTCLNALFEADAASGGHASRGVRFYVGAEILRKRGLTRQADELRGLA